MQSSKLKDFLITRNLALVVKLVSVSSQKGVEFFDLVQVGASGLIKAVERFEPKRGYRFSTFASWWIQSGVKFAVMTQKDIVRVAAHRQDGATTITRFRSSVLSEKGREPTLEEYQEYSGLSLEVVEDILERSAHRKVSLSDPIKDGGGIVTLLDVLPAPDDGPDINEWSNHKYSRDVLSCLSERERYVICSRFGFDSPESLTLKTIGESLGVTRERARQIEAAALMKMKKHARALGLSWNEVAC